MDQPCERCSSCLGDPDVSPVGLRQSCGYVDPGPEDPFLDLPLYREPTWGGEAVGEIDDCDPADWTDADQRLWDLVEAEEAGAGPELRDESRVGGGL